MNFVQNCIVFFGFFILLNCDTSKDKNDYLLPPEEMSAIIADLQMVETFSVIPSTMQPFVRDSIDLYSQGVFISHNTKHQVFYHSLKHYSAYPDQLEAIYNQAKVILQSELEKYHSIDETAQETIMAFSMQQIVVILSDTPFKDWLLSETEIDINQFRDSVFTYIEKNDSIILEQGINLSSFKYSYIINATQPVLFNQMREQLKMHVKSL
jgi:hypothetical protein